jgi:hypothetical protein
LVVKKNEKKKRKDVEKGRLVASSFINDRREGWPCSKYWTKCPDQTLQQVLLVRRRMEE